LTELGQANAATFDQSGDDVFARIATRYDALCDIFSLRLHRGWKDLMAKRMAAHKDAVILDVASGTGDIPARLLRKGGAPSHLMVTDLCPQMLSLAREKLAHADRVSFEIKNAEDLREVASDSIDVYSISFGMKICARDAVIREARRVLKPGGHFYCLEAARIPIEPIHQAYLAYMSWCMPLIGRLAANGDASAYTYLLRGVREFPGQRRFAEELEAAGFEAVRFTNMSLGIVALHEARKPA
jgi:demethylmenaquinone methyltransferase / 2-methoxy-6-polyprenyl-1,4-benzoquinol methylase